MEPIPATMRGLVVRKYGPPSTYEIMELPVPTIELPDEVLIKVRSGGMTGGDAQLAQGGMKLLWKMEFPIKLGAEGSGIVVAVGTGVTRFKPGDAVYGWHHRHPFLPMQPPGFASEYAITREALLLPKPPGLSWEDAASLILPTVTAYQCAKLAVALSGGTGENLEGKTVFMQSGLGAFGSVGGQMLKNVFGAERLITTVSTRKMSLVEERLPGLFDQVVDYQTQDVAKEVGRGSVDLVFNTQWTVESTIQLLKPQTGVIVSIASLPAPRTLRSLFGEAAPRWMLALMWSAQWWYVFKLRGTNIKHEYVSPDPGRTAELERAGELIALGKVKAVTTVVDLEDIDEVRRVFAGVHSGKGGLGTFVIRVSQD